MEADVLAEDVGQHGHPGFPCGDLGKTGRTAASAFRSFWTSKASRCWGSKLATSFLGLSFLGTPQAKPTMIAGCVFLQGPPPPHIKKWCSFWLSVTTHQNRWFTPKPRHNNSWFTPPEKLVYLKACLPQKPRHTLSHRNPALRDARRPCLRVSVSPCLGNDAEARELDGGGEAFDGTKDPGRWLVFLELDRRPPDGVLLLGAPQNHQNRGALKKETPMSSLGTPKDSDLPFAVPLNRSQGVPKQDTPI